MGAYVARLVKVTIGTTPLIGKKKVIYINVEHVIRIDPAGKTWMIYLPVDLRLGTVEVSEADARRVMEAMGYREE